MTNFQEVTDVLDCEVCCQQLLAKRAIALFCDAQLLGETVGGEGGVKMPSTFFVQKRLSQFPLSTTGNELDSPVNNAPRSTKVPCKRNMCHTLLATMCDARLKCERRSLLASRDHKRYQTLQRGCWFRKITRSVSPAVGF